MFTLLRTKTARCDNRGEGPAARQSGSDPRTLRTVVALGLMAWCPCLFAGEGSTPSGGGRGEGTKRQPAGIEVEADHLDWLDEGFVGVVVPRRTVDLAPRIEGRLEGLRVGLGDRVSPGEVVAILEKGSIEAELKAAEAAMREATSDVEIARLNLADAQEHCDRLEDLSEASKTEREATQAEHARDVAAQNVKVAEARAEQASAKVDNLGRLLDDCKVRASFEGAVAGVYQQSGAVVGPEVPVVRIISDKELLIRFARPERDSADVAIGTRIVFRSRDGKVTLRGHVERAAPGIDAASSYRIFEAVIDASAGSDRSPAIGLEGRVRPVASNEQG